MNRAAFFDLDRTLVRVNTARLYARTQFRAGAATRKDLATVSWWLLRYTFGAIDAEAIARQVTRPLKGQREDEFRARVEEWVTREVLHEIAPRAREEVARRREAGYALAILTTSSPYAAWPVARELGIDHVLSSELEVRDGRFTGEPVLPLCYGSGKVTLAERWAAARQIELSRSVFFTDSVSDVPMLMRVGEPVVVNPDPRLRLAAWRRKWPVQQW